MNLFERYISSADSILTIFSCGIAIYLFLFKRKKISRIINYILNYSNQLTVSELKNKIERMNDFSAEDPEGLKEIVNLLNDIEGQVNGNKILKANLTALKKVQNFCKKPNLLSEPKKRSLVSELKENMRFIELSIYNKNLT